MNNVEVSTEKLIEESIERGKKFIERLKKSKQNVVDASKYVVPRNVTKEEFQEAIDRFNIANNQVIHCNMEHFDTSCMKLTLEETELNKLFLAAKLYKQQIA